VKLEKAAVQDGICSWENPVYETMKLIRESKTGKVREKIYHFIVSAVRKKPHSSVLLSTVILSTNAET